jgi:hypothetical protein
MPWYPHSLVFAGWSHRIPIFQKAAEHRHFLSLCKLLGVANTEDLVQKFQDGYKKHQIKQWWQLATIGTNWNALMNIEKLDTVK